VLVNDLSLPMARPRPLPGRLAPWRRCRRVVAIALGLCLLPTTISYLTTMTQPSNSTFVIRSFEWLRDQGAAGLAVTAEDVYYSLSAPSTGGPGLHALPGRGLAATRSAAVHPPRVAPVIAPALGGEGVWVPSESWTGSSQPVQITQFRSDPNYPRMVAGVAWINAAQTRIALNPGRLEPAVSLPRGPMEVPTSLRGRLLASFNSGFKLQDSGGGFAVGGSTYAPMRTGMATLVHYTDGRIDVVGWSGGPRVAPGVDFARQNLPLIVESGRPNPNLSDGPAWGVTVGNAIRVWRSGIGVDARGNLIYAAASDQTVSSLAAILIHSGAVRAMQLDINSYWVSFITYAHPDGGSPTNLLPAMTRPSSRYLTPDDRDFFAVYAR